MNIKHLSALVGASLFLVACGGDDDSNPSNPAPEEPSIASFELSVTNLTVGQPLSPVALVVADDSYRLFEIGEPASIELEYIAEGGDNSFLISALESSSTVASGAGIIAPGMSETIEFSLPEDALDASYLSAVTMLVNTNDAITAIRGISLAGMEVGESISRRTVAYDSGTEANSEMAGTIPGPADGGEGFNAERDDEDRVYFHSGVITSADGYADSVLTQAHRFDNPVTLFSITRVE